MIGVSAGMSGVNRPSSVLGSGTVSSVSSVHVTGVPSSF